MRDHALLPRLVPFAELRRANAHVERVELLQIRA